MANPIIQSVGATSGPGTPGQGRKDLVPGERVDLSDTELANAGHPHFWEWDDTPLDVTPPTINDANTELPWFIVDADPLLPGSYRIKSTVDGLESSVEVLAVPTANIGSRIPADREETEYDGNGNATGWHRSQTDHMRAVDAALGDIGSSTERTSSIAVPIGSSVKTIKLGRVVYPGSLLALAAEIDEAITSGSVLLEAKVNGAVKLSVTLVAGTPSTDDAVAAGVHVLANGDTVEITVTTTAHANASSTSAGVAITTYLSNTIASTPISIANASNVAKGITKLSVAPAVPTEPVAAGTNDTRIPAQTEADALVGTSGTPSAGNPYVTDADPRNSDARTPVAHTHAHADTTGQTTDDHHAQVHALGGSDHTSATLAEVNALVSDATLDDSGNPRDPTAHTHVEADITDLAHSAGASLLLPASQTCLEVVADGSDNHIELDSVSAEAGGLGLQGLAFTMEIWFKPSSLGVTHSLIGRGRTSGGLFGSVLNVSDQSLEFQGRTTAGNATITFAHSLRQDQWVHYAVTRLASSGLTTLYIDGLAVASSVQGAGLEMQTETGLTWNIGGDSINPGEHADGRFFEARKWNVVRTPEQILANYRSTLAGNETGLNGYWRFDGDFTDSTVNGNDMTAVGGAAPAPVADVVDAPFSDRPEEGAAPLIEGAFKFNGTVGAHDIKSIAQYSSFYIHNEIPGDTSLQCWFKVDTLLATMYLISQRGAGGSVRNFALALTTSGTILRYQTYTGGATRLHDLALPATIVEGVWYQVSAVKTRVNGGVRFFLNGEFIGENIIAGSAGQNQATADNALYIGGDQGASDFNGLIAESRVWSAALTDEEVRQNYNRRLNGNEPSLEAYYPGNDLLDRTNNAFHLVITGDPTVVTDRQAGRVTAHKLSTDAADIVLGGVAPSAGDGLIADGAGKAAWTPVAQLGVAQAFSKNQRSEVVVLTDGATVNYTASDSNIYELVATNIGSRTLANPGGLVKGMTWQVWFVQDSTDGLEALLFDTFYDWGDDVTPDFTAQGVNVVNIITCIALSATKIRAITSFGA